MPMLAAKANHLVVLMLENRSFDHMLGFAGMPEWAIDGLRGDEFNPDPAGQPVVVAPDARDSGDLWPDPGHSHFDTMVQIYGGADPASIADPPMNGFVKSYSGKTSDPSRAGNVMKCFGPHEVPILVQLARHFAVCDRWFSSLPGPTLPNRAFAHAATSLGKVDMGALNWLDLVTIYERLGDRGVSSRIYYPDSTIAMTFRRLWANQGQVFGDMDDFLNACRHDELPSYCFIEPRYANGTDDDGGFLAANDEHPDNGVDEGERLIHTVFNAIWSNPQVRNSTVLVIVYDEHGGIFDHVPPPAAVNPDGKVWGGSRLSSDPPFDFRRLGVRVPAVLVSPFIPSGTVDHTVYDHTSLIATARKLFLGPAWQDSYLTERDRAANTFEALLGLDNPRYEAISFQPPPDPPTATIGDRLNARPTEHLQAHLRAAEFLESQRLAPENHTGIDIGTVGTNRGASAYLRSIHAYLRRSS